MGAVFEGTRSLDYNFSCALVPLCLKPARILSKKLAEPVNLHPSVLSRGDFRNPGAFFGLIQM